MSYNIRYFINKSLHNIHGSVDNEPQHLPGCFVWYSDIFASKYHDRVDAFLLNKDKRYKSYFLFHSILDAADIKTEYVDNHLNISQGKLHILKTSLTPKYILIYKKV